MKKAIYLLGLAILVLSFGATISRADEPVLSFNNRFMEISQRIIFPDGTLALDTSASREIPARETLDNVDPRFKGRYEWRNVVTAPIPQSVPEPSALLFLLCGCWALTALSRKLAGPNS
jgi:hypothetical protein